MKISFTKPGLPETGVLVVTGFDGGEFSDSAKAIDKVVDGTLSRAAKVAKFKGKTGEMVSLLAPAGTKLERVLLVGAGKEKKLDLLTAEKLGGTIYMALAGKQPRTVTIAYDAVEESNGRVWEEAAHVAFGALLRSFRFDKYRTKEEADKKPSIRALKIMTPSGGRARKAFDVLSKVVDGVFLTRNLVSEPANILYPESFADTCRELSELGVEVNVLGEAEMHKLNMGALLGVGQGSVRESKLVTMRWNGVQGRGRKAQATQIAFVGKGVTFDTGGISIKPSGGMEDMKWDMGGAGTVTGLMKALAGRKAEVNVVGVIGLVENMPDGNAQRPGDVVTSMSGQTIEVINTDAEGRLVLADALTYTQEEFEPKTMINLATLTGAMLVSLGNERAGVFANDEELAEQLKKAGDDTGEKVWPFPMDSAYDDLLKSKIADMKNTGGRFAGSISAAKFLQRFVKDTKWAHIDIAGMAWSNKERPTVPQGGTGYGVRLLDRLVAKYYEA
ncbi:putative cytosol aminopeptidase [Candidatus Terasakiella magnetica]|uniref:Probable cytosol aminopeptidase n=1 Tax=Candidatus Terasakiella magnetica TaxID=1867952 RepID=A0A1C3RK02_9PROT|nr:leucyl aminopeptidase [Candidatus Terasakiella magnetica]SCA57614.1 putative cytosol aminopeptidase [Candidatus Terasakiella magnetica]